MNDTDDLRKSAQVYTVCETDDMSPLQKKFYKKYPDVMDNTDNFGRNQNDFNSQLVSAFEELSGHCRKLEQALAAEVELRKKDTSAIAAMKKELDAVRLRSTLNTNQLDKTDKTLMNFSERTEDYILHIAPGARLKDCPKGCREARIDDSVNMPDRLEAIRKADAEERGSRLADFEKVCMKAVSRELSYYNAYEEIGIDFYGTGKLADIIYRNLCKNSIYKIESGQNSRDSGRYFVSCGEKAAIPEKAFLKSGMVLVTGHDPFDGLDGQYIDDLRFLNDCGIHSYTAMNTDAYTALKKAGFRNIRIASAEELAGGEIISAVEKGIENAIPNGAEKYSVFVRKLEHSGTGFARTPEEIMGYVMKCRTDEDCTAQCIKSLEKTASAAIIKNYFGSASITSADITQPLGEPVDLLTGFDYISHFNYTDRVMLYQKAKKMLKPGGLLLFSGKDPVTAIKIRAVDGWEKYPVYEAMWTPVQLAAELEENGFRVRFLIPTGTGLYDMLPSKYKNIPSLCITGAEPVLP